MDKLTVLSTRNLPSLTATEHAASKILQSKNIRVKEKNDVNISFSSIINPAFPLCPRSQLSDIHQLQFPSAFTVNDRGRQRICCRHLDVRASRYSSVSFLCLSHALHVQDTHIACLGRAPSLAWAHQIKEMQMSHFKSMRCMPNIRKLW